MSDPIEIKNIRNFCIIAHIDHGKSTLADRILDQTRAVADRHKRDQMLDSMDLERERGITIKASAVEIRHQKDGVEYLMHLIDTPGHVDFSYEVSRSMAACEGAILLVDAAQGVEAQTAANAYLAVEGDLEIIPVLNKVDLPTARPEEVIEEIESVIGLPAEDVMTCSAKTGRGVPELLDAVVDKFPPPSGDPEAPLQAMIIDSVFDDYRGVIVYVRIVNGKIERRQKVKMLSTHRAYEVTELGKFRPALTPTDSLQAGEVGYLICNIKTIHDVKIGDTVTHDKSDVEQLSGFQEPVPYVFCGLYPSTSGDYEALRRALEKLHLNDASFSFLPETSDALGFGFRAGFLGLLHMEIVQERLERESGVDLVQTPPNVTYKLIMTSGEERHIDSPSKLPEGNTLREIQEPIADVNMILPQTAIGPIMKICEERRGNYIKTEYLGPDRVLLHYELPLSEIIFDFYDKLKSATQGFGTMDYHVKEYRAARLVKLRILVNQTEVDALSMIVHFDEAQKKGRQLLLRLKKEIPRHMFEVPLQAAIGGKVIARESIHAMRKNVTAKCYGGDITRKRKLIEKQKAGKRRMKSVGNVEIPQSAFLSALKLDDNNLNPGEPEVLQAPAAKEIAQPEPEPFFRDIFEALAMAIIFSLCVKQFALEAYKVPTGSMEPTIHGDPKVGDRILVNKLAYIFRDPRRWEIAVFQFPNNRKINYIKRIVGVGGEHGETLAIRGGDIYTMPFDVERIDDYLENYKSGEMTIQRKPQKVQDAIFARYPQIEESETVFADEETFVRHWVLPREEIEPRATWSFDGGMVVRAPGSESLVNYRRRITDSRLGITRQEDFSAVGKDPVGDIKVELTVEPIEAGGELVIDLRDPAHSQPLRLHVPVKSDSDAGTLPLRILVNRKVIAEDKDFELPVGESTRIAMSNVDDRIQVHVNDVLIMSAEYEHEPLYRDTMSAAQRTSFGAKNATIRIARAQIYRDLYHQSYRSCRIPPGHYYMLGDNSRASKDSREWQRITIHPEVRNGKAVYGDREAVENPNDLEQRLSNPFVRDDRSFFVDEFGNLLELTGKNYLPIHSETSPLVPRRLLTGRAFAVFWPWERMQVVR